MSDWIRAFPATRQNRQNLGLGSAPGDFRVGSSRFQPLEDLDASNPPGVSARFDRMGEFSAQTCACRSHAGDLRHHRGDFKVLGSLQRNASRSSFRPVTEPRVDVKPYTGPPTVTIPDGLRPNPAEGFEALQGALHGP